MSKYGMLPDNKRKCRDALGCILFLAFWVGMLIIGGIAITVGQWQRLLYGTDYQGNVCATGGRGTFTTYPQTTLDFIANYGKSPTDYRFYGICVSACPAVGDIVCNYDTPTLPLSAVSKEMKTKCINNFMSGDALPATGVAAVSCQQVNANCWFTPVVTSPIMFRCIPSYNQTSQSTSVCTFPTGVSSASDPRCVLQQTSTASVTQTPAQPNYLFQQLSSAQSVWGRYFGDLARCWWVILICAVGVAVGLGFIFVNLLKYFTGCMVWTVIAVCVGLLAFLTGYFYYMAGLVTNTATTAIATTISSSSAVTTVSNVGASLVPSGLISSATGPGSEYAIIAYVATAILIIVLCMIVSLLSSINMAIEVVKIGADALRRTPTLLLFPLTTILSLGLFVVWWLFVTACLASAGTITATDIQSTIKSGTNALPAGVLPASFAASLAANATNGTAVSSLSAFTSNNNTTYLLIYHFFGLLWTVAFIQGITTLTIAGTVCGWYFSQLPADDKDEEHKKLLYTQGRFPVCSALRRTVRYHLGSIAVGSLLIAFIGFIRAIFAYITKQLEAQGKTNSQVKFLLCCINCCLKCIQSCVEVITRNGYIFIALKGEGFLRAGRRVFGLIKDHGSVFVTVNVLGELIMSLGKCLIAVLSAFAAYLMLNSIPQFAVGGANQLSATWLPILITLFFAYASASGFMMVFDVSVDSILVCYVTDIDENKDRTGHAVAIHMHKDKLAVGKAAPSADGAKGAAKGPSVTGSVA